MAGEVLAAIPTLAPTAGRFHLLSAPGEAWYVELTEGSERNPLDMADSLYEALRCPVELLHERWKD